MHTSQHNSSNSRSTVKPDFNAETVIKVGDIVYQPIAVGEREEIKRNILTRNREVAQFIRDFDEKDEELLEETLSQCMDPTVKGFQYWCENFCYTFDPRDTADPHKRFILFPYQLRDATTLINCIRGQENALLDKSRDMGASWLLVAIITWCWLFDESFHALVGSRKEDLVDDKTIDSLFGKIDYILERLPWWMTPGYNPDKNRKKLRVEHPGGNLITGESANPNFGRGPRKNLVYLDEFAFWPDDKLVWTGISDTSPCKIVTSTPCGEANQFAKLRFGQGDIRIVTQHWTDHPFKDMAWYEAERHKRNYDPVSIAQELDIDYKASAGGLALPMLQQDSFKTTIWVPRVYPTDAGNHAARFYGGFDWGSVNPCSFHVYKVRKIQQHPKLLKIQAVWEYYEPASVLDPSTGLKDMSKIAHYIKACPFYDMLERIYADPSMWYYTQQKPNGEPTSLAYLFRDHHNIHFQPGQKGDTFALEQLKLMWSDPDNIRFEITQDCPHMLKELEGLRYQVQSTVMAQKKNQPEKLVDKDNHAWDDFKYFFNSFDVDAPFVEEFVPNGPMNWTDVKHGWNEINDGLKKLREDKLKKLAPAKRRRRRFFRA